MKQLILSCGCWIMIISQAGAQPVPQWAQRYNGPAGQWDGARAMCVDKDQNVIIAGASEGKRGNRDIVILKYSPAGTQIGIARYNGTGNAEDYPFAVTTDNDGNIYVAGRSTGVQSNHDFITLKYGPGLSQPVWTARYDTAGLFDQAQDLAVDAMGNVFVTGGTAGVGQFSGFVFTTIQYDVNGVQQWVDHLDNLPNPATDAGASREEGVSLVLGEPGTVYVTGISGDMVIVKYQDLVAAGSGHREWVRTVTGGSNGRKILFNGTSVIATGWGGVTVSYDADGVELWRAPQPAASVSFWDMAMDPSGDIIATGEGRSTTTGGDYFTAKYSPTGSGTPLWMHQFDGSANELDYARSVACDRAGSVYVTGYSTVKSGRNSVRHYVLIKYDSEGNFLWKSVYAGLLAGGEAFVVATDALDRVYVTGQSPTKTSSFDIVTVQYPATSPFLPESSIVQKQNDQRNQQMMATAFRAYPVPVLNHATIEFEIPAGGQVRLSVVDALGRELAVLMNGYRQKGSYKLTYSAGGLKPGNYMLRLQNGSKVQSRSFVKAR